MPSCLICGEDYTKKLCAHMNTAIPTSEVMKAIAEWKKDPKYKGHADM